MSVLEWGGQAWQLRPDRTMLWTQRQTLILADPHFGKAQHFRAAGIPVPTGTTQRNLDMLDRAIRETAAERLIILGDFFHAKRGVTPDLLRQLRSWRDRRPDLEMVNVRGNHDNHAGDPPMDLGIDCVAGPWRDLEEQAIAFAHEPASLDDAFTLCGHLHPGVRLIGKGKSRVRAACFHFAQRHAVLPAFGAFTGMAMIKPTKHDRVFAVGPDEVVEVSAKPLRI